MTIRTAFEAKFGADQAAAVWDAATSHANGINSVNHGSDPFKWALLICIGYECMEKDDYRAHHNITAPWPELHAWMVHHGEFSSHDGDYDYLGAVVGVYDGYMDIGAPGVMR